MSWASMKGTYAPDQRVVNMQRTVGKALELDDED